MDNLNWETDGYIFNEEESGRARYIFDYLKDIFPEVMVDEREKIIGIGEAGYRLMCYFSVRDNEVYVKFQSSRRIPLLADIGQTEHELKSVAALYRSDKQRFLLKTAESEPQTVKKERVIRAPDYSYDNTLISPISMQITNITMRDMPRQFSYSLNIPDLNATENIVETSEEVFNKIVDNKKKFDGTLAAVNNFVYQLAVRYEGQRNADIFVERYCSGDTPSLEKVGEKHNLTRERVRQVCNRTDRRLTYSLTKKAFKADKYAVLSGLGAENYLAFMVCCRQNISAVYYDFLKKSVFDFILVEGDCPREEQTEVSRRPKKAEERITEREEHFTEQDGFLVITDEEGRLLTDMELLKVLKDLRTEIRIAESRPAYTVIGNRGLVSLATYRPETKEEFVGLYGLGETTYAAYGAQFINAIKEYEKK